jgi:hypothetical protein
MLLDFEKAQDAQWSEIETCVKRDVIIKLTYIEKTNISYEQLTWNSQIYF